METLPFESQMNITAMTLSPSGNILIAVNEGSHFSVLTCIFSISVCSKKAFMASVFLVDRKSMFVSQHEP